MDRVNASTEFGVAGPWLAEYTLASLGATIILFEQDGGASQWSPGAPAALGVPEAALVGCGLDDDLLGLVDPDGRRVGDAGDPVRQVLQTGEAQMNVVLGAQLPDGTRWNSLTLLPVFGPDGSPRAVLASIVDVTDTFRARTAIAEWQLMAHSLMHQSITADLIVDRTGTILEWNERALRLTGRSGGDVIRTRFDDLCDIDLEWVWTELRRGGTRGIDGTTYVLRHGLGEVPVFGRFTMVRWPEFGDVVAVQLLDPSEFVSGEWTPPEMRESRIFDEAQIAMLVITTRCVVVAANRYAAELFDRPAGDLIGQHVKELIDPYEPAGSVDAGASEPGGEAPFVGDLRVRRSESDVDVRISVTAMSMADPEPGHLLVQLHEVRERRIGEQPERRVNSSAA